MTNYHTVGFLRKSLKLSRMTRKMVACISILFFLWHAYVLLAVPLKFVFQWPAQSTANRYSSALRMYSSWSFFSEIFPYDLILTQKSLDNSRASSAWPENIYMPATDYLGQMRFYRCGLCANAAYQLHLRSTEPADGWLIKKILCSQSKDSRRIHLYRTSSANGPPELLQELVLQCSS